MLFGCVKVFPCIPRTNLVPREAGGGLAMPSWGKIAARSGKTPVLSPASQGCQAEWAQLGIKSPSWHPVVPVIFLLVRPTVWTALALLIFISLLCGYLLCCAFLWMKTRHWVHQFPSGYSLWCTLLWMKSQQNTNSSIPEYCHCL